MRTVPSITLNRVTPILHPSQLKYKNRIKPKRWWKLTTKIQSFRLNQKQKYSKPTRFNIPNLLPDLLPSVLDFNVGSKEYHQQINILCSEVYFTLTGSCPVGEY